MKKRLLCLLPALALCLCLVAPAAGDPSTSPAEVKPGTNGSVALTGSYDPTPAVVVSVDVAWGNMTFLYAAQGTTGTWLPGEHRYEGATDKGTWIDPNADITVTNHSNAAVTIGLTFEKAGAGVSNDLTGSFTARDGVTLTDNKMTIATAEKTDRDNAPSGTVTFAISGGSINAADTEVTIGTIKVSVTADTASTPTA